MGKIIISLFFFTLITFSCNETNLPKQNGFLRIEFIEPYYTIHEEIDIPFNFYYNSNYTYIDQIGNDQFLLDYKDLNLSINLSFYNIKTKLDLEKKSRDFSLILDTHIKKSNGIVLVYSQYLLGGCIPLALALEESGYKKYDEPLFKDNLEREEKGSYIMITGKSSLTKNFKNNLNVCNSAENKDGSKINKAYLG